jgi:hypothetical protein
MPVACELAGVSALEATMRPSLRSRNRARGAASGHRPSSWLQTALDHVARAWRRKAAYRPVRAGRPRPLLSIESRRTSRAARGFAFRGSGVAVAALGSPTLPGLCEPHAR